MKTVGAFEAKTHFSSLLDDVARGEQVTVTRHGTPVARIVPVSTPQRMTSAEAVERLKVVGKGLSLKGLNIKEMISEGRH